MTEPKERAIRPDDHRPASPPDTPGHAGAPVDGRALKGRRGLRRLRNALGYSRDGLRAAWRQEDAFRQEVWLALVLVPVALVLPLAPIERAMLVASVFIVLIVELLNTAIEAVVDRHGYEIEPLAKQAKDFGSAAVFLSIAQLVVVWALIVGARWLV